MKYFMLVPDGCGDWPIQSLGGKTPLEAADIKNINALAKSSEIGLVRTVPEGFEPGSEANVMLLGYGADAYLTGRAPLEAAAMGIEMSEAGVAFRVNLITVAGGGRYEDLIIKDHSAGEIGNEEAEILIEFIDRELGADGIRFYPGVSYRCLMVADVFSGDYKFTPPHDVLNQSAGAYLPQGDGAERISELIRRSHKLLEDHPVNRERVKKGFDPANSIWIWGHGKKPTLAPFSDKYGIRGSVITAVNLVKGYGLCAGLKVVDVPGATGTLNTNYDGKAQSAIDEFESGADFVFVHVEAPDECSHGNDLDGKIKSLEFIDEKIFKPVVQHLESSGQPYRVLVVTDHKTPIKTRTHCAEPVPFVLFDSENKLPEKSGNAFSEVSGQTGTFFESGRALTDYFLR